MHFSYYVALLELKAFSPESHREKYELENNRLRAEPPVTGMCVSHCALELPSPSESCWKFLP